MGGSSFLVKAGEEKFVVKQVEENSMNHPENEILLCRYLEAREIRTCTFVPNKQGQYLSKDEAGNKYQVKRFIEGEVLDYFEAPAWLLPEMAKLLGRIHTVLAEYEELPVGIGKSFFEFCTVEGALHGYEETLQHAMQMGDEENVRYIQSNMELMRSYLYASPKCKYGEIDIAELVSYIRSYKEVAPLTRYDLESMEAVFARFSAVCNFFGQYYALDAKNRSLFLKQAVASTGFLRWYDQHGEELRSELSKLAE